MSETSDSLDARIQALERSVIEMREQTHSILEAMKNFLPTQNPVTNESEVKTESVAPTPDICRPNTLLKPGVPPDYDGDRTRGKAFLTSCRTYIRLVPDAFPDEPTKIIWAMSFMKNSRAARWAERALESEASTGVLPWVDWLDFEDDFRKYFTPPNAAAAAINTLEGTNYFQNRRTVDEYLDGFLDLIQDSGYSDPKTIVVKFRRGLDRRISSALGSLAVGRPSDTDPDAWYAMATTLDQNRAAEEAFQSSFRAPALTPTPRPLTRFTPAYSAPPLPTPVPTDPAARRQPTPPGACNRCGKPGHWAKDCPLRHDVRHLQTDELHKIIEDRMAAMDVAEAEAGAPERLRATELKEEEEDFLLSSE